jgi:hypothetical protein
MQDNIMSQSLNGISEHVKLMNLNLFDGVTSADDVSNTTARCFLCSFCSSAESSPPSSTGNGSADFHDLYVNRNPRKEGIFIIWGCYILTNIHLGVEIPEVLFSTRLGFSIPVSKID